MRSKLSNAAALLLVLLSTSLSCTGQDFDAAASRDENPLDVRVKDEALDVKEDDGGGHEAAFISLDDEDVLEDDDGDSWTGGNSLKGVHVPEGANGATKRYCEKGAGGDDCPSHETEGAIVDASDDDSNGMIYKDGIVNSEEENTYPKEEEEAIPILVDDANKEVDEDDIELVDYFESSVDMLLDFKKLTKEQQQEEMRVLEAAGMKASDGGSGVADKDDGSKPEDDGPAEEDDCSEPEDDGQTEEDDGSEPEDDGHAAPGGVLPAVVYDDIDDTGADYDNNDTVKMDYEEIMFKNYLYGTAELTTSRMDVPLRDILLGLKPPSLPVSGRRYRVGDLDTDSDHLPYDNYTDTNKGDKKAACIPSPTEDTVQLLNATGLQSLVSPNPNITSRALPASCLLVFFYSPACQFSVAAVPAVNAATRALRGVLPVYGVDSVLHHSINAQYGVMGTPTLLLFHNGHSVAQYSNSSYTAQLLTDFLRHHTTDLMVEAAINITVEDETLSPPLPLTVTPVSGMSLAASWLLLTFMLCYCFARSSFCDNIIEAVLNSWREAEAHLHED